MAANACSSVGVDKIHPSTCSSTDKTFGSPRASLFCRPECLCANICGETPRFLWSAGGLLFPLQSWEDKRPTRKHNPSNRCDHRMHRGICISKDVHKRAGPDVAEESDMNTVRFYPQYRDSLHSGRHGLDTLAIINFTQHVVHMQWGKSHAGGQMW